MSPTPASPEEQKERLRIIVSEAVGETRKIGDVREPTIGGQVREGFKEVEAKVAELKEKYKGNEKKTIRVWYTDPATGREYSERVTVSELEQRVRAEKQQALAHGLEGTKVVMTVDEARAPTAGDVIEAAKAASKGGIPLVETPYPQEWRVQAHEEYMAMSPLNQLLFHFAAQGAKGVDYYAAALIPGGRTGQQVAEQAYIENVVMPRATGVKPDFLQFFTSGMVKQPATWLAVLEAGGYVSGAVVKSVGTGIKAAFPLVWEVVETELVGPIMEALSTPIGQAAGKAVMYGPVAYRAVQSYTTFTAEGYDASRSLELVAAQSALEFAGVYGFGQGFQAGLKYGSPIKLGTFSAETPTGLKKKSLLLYAEVGQSARVLGGVTATERAITWETWPAKGYRLSFSLGAPSFDISVPQMPFTPLEYELLKGPTSRYYASRGATDDIIKWDLGAQLTRNFGSPDFVPKMEFEDVLKETRYVERSASGLARYLKSHSDLMVYGSTVQKMYMGEDFPRQLADIDIQQVPGISGLSTEAHVENIYNIMKAEYGGAVRISPETPTLIEVNVGGQWHHGIDFHPIDASAGYSPGQQEFLGLGIRSRAPQVTENILMMQFPEQVQRKGVSITTPGLEAVGPEPHRIKDIGDFMAGYEFTLEAYPDLGKSAQLKTLKAAWGLKDIQVPSPTLFSYNPSATGSSATFIPPPLFFSPPPSGSPKVPISLPSYSGWSKSASASISSSLSLPSSTSASISSSLSPSVPSSPPFRSPPSRLPSRSPSPSLSVSPGYSPSIRLPSYPSSPPSRYSIPPSSPPSSPPFGITPSSLKLGPSQGFKLKMPRGKSVRRKGRKTFWAFPDPLSAWQSELKYGKFTGPPQTRKLRGRYRREVLFNPLTPRFPTLEQLRASRKTKKKAKRRTGTRKKGLNKRWRFRLL